MELLRVVNSSNRRSVTRMAAHDILFTFIGSFVAPVLLVLAFALFIHCILTIHRNREQRACGSGSLLTTPQALRLQRTPADEDPV